MDTHKLTHELNSGNKNPVYLIVGSERFLINRAVKAIRTTISGKSPDAFNEEVFFGKSTTAHRIIEAARTLPMVSSMRLILVRGLDYISENSLDPLVRYLEDPSPTTCLIMTAEKLDGRSRLAKIAKKNGFWIDAASLKANQLRGFCVDEARLRGHKLDSSAASTIVDSLGNDLSAISDAIEKLSLYVGSGQPIGMDAITTCVSRIRVESIWTLVDAVGVKNQSAALQAASSLLTNREPPLKILAMVARQLRIVARMRHALSSGIALQEAARMSGAPPFKARDLATAAKTFKNADLATAFRVLAETDIALKSSKRPPETILQHAIIELTSP